MKRIYKFENNIGEITTCDIYMPAKQIIAKPLVLLIHGFRAFKDWGFFPYFATKLAESGYFAVAIDFSLNALLDRDKSIFDMKKFSRNTVTQEITEARMFINKLKKNPEEILSSEDVTCWNGMVYIIGHSLGGAIAIMTADKNPAVKKLVTINSIFDFDIYTERQKQNWIEQGIKQFTDVTTLQDFTLDVNFLLDRLTYIHERSVCAVVSRLEIPYYILHSAADATVSPKSATILLNAIKNKAHTQMELIKYANHTFGIKHPFRISNPILDEVIDKTINFLNEY